MFLAPLRPSPRSTILRLSLLPGTRLSRPLSKQATAVGDSVWFECFDRPSHYGSSRFQDTTGLFGDRRLAHPQDFQSVANDALLKAQGLVERITNAPSSRAELSQLVDNLDKLSDVLCSVIDLAELVRSTHPDTDWVEHANTVYESLCEYMNVLNTHAGLDSVRFSYHHAR
jgi:intermediate peptidase